MRIALLAALLALTGCSYERNGVVHHVIVGFGVISVTKTNPVATVTKTQALGISAIGPQISIGYVNGTVALVDKTATNLNLIIK